MIEIEGCGPGVSRIRIGHGKANALDRELCEGLASGLRELGERDHAAVLTGTGSIFSAGVDLKRLLADGDEYLVSFLGALRDVFAAALEYPRPLVAAVNGHAIAGGCILAAACDQRLMAHGSGRIGIPELLVGVPFPTLALEVMRGLVAPHVLQRLVWRGETLLPEAALAVGLVDELVVAEELDQRAVDLATRLARIPTRTFELTRGELRAPMRILLAQLEDHDREVVQAWRAPEIRAAISEWVERTIRGR